MARDADPSPVIDEEGNLFGLVNVVDALVVLLVLSAAAAGTALVLEDEAEKQTSPESTRYATVAFTVPMESDGVSVEAGDSLRSTRGGEAFEITDVYRSFEASGSESAYVVARIAYNGTLTESGNRRYGGDRLVVAAGTYRTEATVVAVNRTTATIPTRRHPVVLSVNETVARTLEPGQQVKLAGRTVGTIETITSGPEQRGKRLVTARLVTWERTTAPYFGNQSVRVGNSITLLTEDAVVTGRIHAVSGADSDDA